MPVVVDVVATVLRFVVGRVARLVAIIAGVDVQRVVYRPAAIPVVVDAVAVVPKFAVGHAGKLVAIVVGMIVRVIVHHPVTTVA